MNTRICDISIAVLVGSTFLFSLPNHVFAQSSGSPSLTTQAIQCISTITEQPQCLSAAPQLPGAPLDSSQCPSISGTITSSTVCSDTSISRQANYFCGNLANPAPLISLMISYEAQCQIACGSGCPNSMFTYGSPSTTCYSSAAEVDSNVRFHTIEINISWTCDCEGEIHH